MFSSLVAVLASRRGSFSLPRRKEDYTFDRSTLQSVRASGCAGTALPPVFFLLTSTPNRADRLPVLLGTMRAQSHPPTGVVLTIPRMPPGARTPQPRRPQIDPPLSHVQAALWTGVFARFNESYRLPGAAQWPELRVHRIAADAGPLSKVRAWARARVRVRVRVPWLALALTLTPTLTLTLTKYLGALTLPPESIVVVGDDDMAYARTFIEDFACAVATQPADLVFSAVVDGSCGALGGCVMGFRGVAMRAGTRRDAH